MAAPLNDMASRRRLSTASLFLLVFCAYLLLVWGYHGTASVTWMRVLDLEAFRSPADVWTYLAELRTGIPPLLSALELFWWVEFRDLSFFYVTLYPVSIALAFTFSVMIQRQGPVTILLVFLLGLFLARFGVEVHAGNPANYDPLFAVLLLGYFLLIDGWLRSRRPVWLVGAGLTLAVLELTRPFMVFLLPVFVLVECHRILRATPRYRAALAGFLLPILLLSGGWHLHLYLAHDGQIAWTNISGFNLQRAWQDFDTEIRDARSTDELPHRGDLWADLNRSDVYRESEALKGLILDKILDDPPRAMRHAADRIVEFAGAPTGMYHHDPQGAGIALYRGAVVALNLLLATYVAVGAVLLLHQRRWPWLEPRWWLAASVLLVALLVALAEKGEEARFLFSILPMLLAVAGFACTDVQTATITPSPAAVIKNQLQSRSIVP